MVEMTRSILLGPLLSLLLVGSVLASGAIDLGPPSDAVPSGHVLGAFHRIRQDIHQGGKPELLFIGTMVDGDSAAERWPVVKALDQFGTWSGLHSTATRSCVFQRTGTLTCAPLNSRLYTGYTTFDLERAVYRSRYLAFVHKDLIDGNLQMRQHLSSLELLLFNRYARRTGFPHWHDAVWRTAADASAFEPKHRFPLVTVGGYLETGANVAIVGDLTPATSNKPLPFGTIQASLQHGAAIDGAPPSLLTDFNAEANVITALICHADGKKPTSVCDRPVIKAILKSVK
jgi:hypothetical protein